MMKKLLLTTAMAVGLAAGAAGAAMAAPITFNFTSADFTDAYGASQAYTTGAPPVTITAYSGSYNGTTVTRGGILVGNNRGTDEQGLGVCLGSTSFIPTSSPCNVFNYDNNPEIDASSKEVVQLDITNLLAAGYNSLSVNADSATSGELLLTYGSTTSTGLGTLLASISSAAGNVAIAQNGNFLNFISNGPNENNVLLHSLTADKVATPEPVSVALLGVGLLGLGMTRRMRTKG